MISPSTVAVIGSSSDRSPFYSKISDNEFEASQDIWRKKREGDYPLGKIFGRIRSQWRDGLRLTKDFASDINRMPGQEKKNKIWEINEK
jgi:hypothetical protein